MNPTPDSTAARPADAPERDALWRVSTALFHRLRHLEDGQGEVARQAARQLGCLTGLAGQNPDTRRLARGMAGRCRARLEGGGTGVPS